MADERLLEGVVEWWLLEKLTTNYATRVKEALAELVFARLVLERRGKDSRTYYKVNPLKLEEIMAFHNEKGRKPP